MKKYKVEAIMKFADKEEDIRRLPCDKNLTEEENIKRGSIFYCTKERYEYLRVKSAVKLIEIVEKEEISEEEVQAIANEQDKTIKEVVDEVVEEIVKKKRKKSKK